jgi:hypothetical protein
VHPSSFHSGDPAGQVRGSFPDDVVQDVLDRVRTAVESEGWGRPFSIWGVERTPPGGRTAGTAGVELVKIAEGFHPLEDLPGNRLPRQFDAAILVTEEIDLPDTTTSAAVLAGVRSPDPVEETGDVRFISYLSRSGDGRTLLLHYHDGSPDPEEIGDGSFDAGGRVQDSFRRYVGLPVSTSGRRVVELLGRLWLMQAASVLMENPTTPVAEVVQAGDPLDTMLHLIITDAAPGDETDRDILRQAFGAAASLAGSDGGGPIYRALLEAVDSITWSSALNAARLGAFPVVLPREMVDWCDEGLFAKRTFEETIPQSVIVDGLLMAGFPEVADVLVTRLRERDWLERPPAHDPAPRPADDDDCPCGSELSYAECHGSPLA